MANFNISIAFPFIESKIEGKILQSKPPLATTSGKRPPHVGDLFFQNTKRFQVKSLKMETNLF